MSSPRGGSTFHLRLLASWISQATLSPPNLASLSASPGYPVRSACSHHAAAPKGGRRELNSQRHGPQPCALPLSYVHRDAIRRPALEARDHPSSRGIRGDAYASRGAGVGKTERKGTTAIQTLASSYLTCSEHPRQDLNLQYPGPKPGALSVELRGLKKSINIVGYHPTGLFVSRHRGKSPAKS